MPTINPAVARIRKAKKLIDAAAGEGLVEAHESMGELVLILNTEHYEREFERSLVLVPTKHPNKLKLMYQDGAGYEDLIGILTVAPQ
jgi:hypothetical protein